MTLRIESYSYFQVSRLTLTEPHISVLITGGMVQAEFSGVRYVDVEKGKVVYVGKNPLLPADIAETVLLCEESPAHVNIQEVIVYRTEQASVHTTAR